MSRVGQGGPVVRACPVCQRQVIHAFRGDVTALGDAQIVRVGRDGAVYVACACGKTNTWRRERPATVCLAVYSKQLDRGWG